MGDWRGRGQDKKPHDKGLKLCSWFKSYLSVIFQMKRKVDLWQSLLQSQIGGFTSRSTARVILVQVLSIVLSVKPANPLGLSDFVKLDFDIPQGSYQLCFSHPLHRTSWLYYYFLKFNTKYHFYVDGTKLYVHIIK